MSDSVWDVICIVGTYAHQIIGKTLGFDDQRSPTADQIVCVAHEIHLPNQHKPHSSRLTESHNQTSGLNQVCEILHPEDIQQQPFVSQRHQLWENSNRDELDSGDVRNSDLRYCPRVTDHHDEIVNRDGPSVVGRQEHNEIPHRGVSITRRVTGFLGQSLTTVFNL